MRQKMENPDITRWVKQLKSAVRVYHLTRGAIIAWRVLTASLFLGLMTLTFMGRALPPPNQYNNPAEPPETASTTSLRHLAASGAIDGALTVLFGLAISACVLLPERRYPILEASALSLRDINALAQAAALPDAEVRAYVSQRLCPLLARVRAEDAGDISPETRQALYDCLKIENARSDFDLICAVLALLTKIGDDEAMPCVRQLALAQAGYNAEERVIVQARYCLKILHSRHVREQERSTLLRPATGDAPSENLLRPANASETPPELLLRPLR